MRTFRPRLLSPSAAALLLLAGCEHAGTLAAPASPSPELAEAARVLDAVLAAAGERRVDTPALASPASAPFAVDVPRAEAAVRAARPVLAELALQARALDAASTLRAP